MAASHPKLAGFDAIETTYKKVDDHAIRTDLFVPQTAASGKRPVIIRIHGGGLVRPHITLAR